MRFPIINNKDFPNKNKKPLTLIRGFLKFDYLNFATSIRFSARFNARSARL